VLPADLPDATFDLVVTPQLTRTVRYDDENFVLEVFQRD
jgi:hypothetical protein